MCRGILLAMLALFPGSALFGQSDGRKPESNAYGVLAESVHVVGSADLDPVNSSVTYGYFSGGRYATVAGGFYGTLRLPAGSVVTKFEIDACDNSSTGEVQAWVSRCVSPFNACFIFADVFTGVSFSDGGSCGTFEEVLATPEVINNEANVYLISASNPGNLTSSTRINAVRVYYKLQVTPAPPTATFADVPTNHPFFQFIEALAASGITAGCGGGNYCPDAALTRGQMAVFLARALGLHWAP